MRKACGKRMKEYDHAKLGKVILPETPAKLGVLLNTLRGQLTTISLNTTFKNLRGCEEKMVKGLEPSRSQGGWAMSYSWASG